MKCRCVLEEPGLISCQCDRCKGEAMLQQAARLERDADKLLSRACKLRKDAKFYKELGRS